MPKMVPVSCSKCKAQVSLGSIPGAEVLCPNCKIWVKAK